MNTLPRPQCDLYELVKVQCTYASIIHLFGRRYRGLGVDLVGEQELRLRVLALVVLGLELLEHGQRGVDVGHLRLELPPPRHQVLLHELVLLVRLVENLKMDEFCLC